VFTTDRVVRMAGRVSAAYQCFVYSIFISFALRQIKKVYKEELEEGVSPRNQNLYRGISFPRQHATI
jgi:hypothetical protein